MKNKNQFNGGSAMTSKKIVSRTQQRIHIKTLSRAAALVLIISGHVSATDWGQWRGPNRDGVSTERPLVDRWPEGGPTLLWKAPGMGIGFAGVSVVGDRIYTMGDLPNGQQCVLSIETSTGKQVWVTPIGPAWTDNYKGPRCTPTVDGDAVYVVSSHGSIACINAVDGKPRWARDFKNDFGGKMMSGWGFSESPLIDGEFLICTPGGEQALLVCLQKKTGKDVWRTPSEANMGTKGKDGAGYSSVVISNAVGRKQYVQLIGRGVVGVDAKTGRLLWGYNKIANDTANISTPIVKDNRVFVSTGYGTGAALVELSQGGPTGVVSKEVWFLEAKDLQNHHGGMVLIGDHIYGGHGNNNGFPICIEMKTGTIAWQKERGPGTGSAAVMAADGKLYFRYENGLMALIGATPSKYEEFGTFQIPDVSQPSWSHPTVANGKLFLREQDFLYCYDIAGSAKASLPTKKNILVGAK